MERRYIVANRTWYRIRWIGYLLRDRLFDFWYRIDSAGIQELDGLTLKGPHHADATYYQTITMRGLRRALSSLPIDCHRYVFIDIGSGKGRVVLMASRSPFKRVIGVEFAREFHDAALKNATSMRWKRKCGAVEFVWADAVDFEFPDEPCVLFLFNPFGEAMLRGVLKNVQRSIDIHGRDIFVIYIYPKHEGAILSQPNAELLAKSPNYATYLLRARRREP